MKKTLLIVLLATGALVHADEVKVELIVFENLDPAALQAESWATDPGLPALNKAAELTSADITTPLPAAAGNAALPATETPPGRLLPPSQLKMAGMVKRLRSSTQYRPLLHLGWIQSMDDPARAGVHLHSGMTNDGDTARAAQAEINGTVAVRRGRFLHADVDLLLKKNTGMEPLSVRLNTSRRLRGNEVHYLDHPLFGVIMSVTPVQDAQGRGSHVQ